MTRSQRRWHSLIWIVLGPVLLAGVKIAWDARPKFSSRLDAAQAASERRSEAHPNESTARDAAPQPEIKP